MFFFYFFFCLNLTAHQLAMLFMQPLHRGPLKKGNASKNWPYFQIIWRNMLIFCTIVRMHWLNWLASIQKQHIQYSVTCSNMLYMFFPFLSLSLSLSLFLSLSLSLYIYIYISVCLSISLAFKIVCTVQVYGMRYAKQSITKYR